MAATLQDFLSLARLTLLSPREGAAKILTLSVPRAILWQLLALIVVVSVLLAWVNLALTPVDVDVIGEEVLAPSPFVFTLLLAGSMVSMVFGVWLIGQVFGGKGRFDDVLLLVIWLQALMILLQVFQSILMLLLPNLAGMVGLLGLGVLTWLLTNFTAVVHGFSSLGRVFLMIVVMFFGISLGFALILILFGVKVGGGI